MGTKPTAMGHFFVYYFICVTVRSALQVPKDLITIKGGSAFKCDLVAIQ